MHLGFGGLERRAFGQLQIDHQLQPTGGGKELLRHDAEQADRADERQQRQDDNRLAPLHTPVDHPPHTLIERRRIRVVALIAAAMVLRMTLGQIGQQLLAQQGHEHHGGDP